METIKLTNKITAHHGDCMEALRGMKDNEYDLAIVDPPYRDENQPNQHIRRYGTMKAIIGRPQQEYWEQLRRASRHQIIWGANNFSLPQFKGFVVWDKVVANDFNMSSSEIAALSEGLATISSTFKLRASGQENRIHETQKPVKLYEWLLMNYAKEGDRILDTHGGSMSIAIACHRLGFELDIYEIDKEYFEAGVKRFKHETSQLRIDI